MANIAVLFEVSVELFFIYVVEFSEPPEDVIQEL
jgi:hypothetical protein